MMETTVSRDQSLELAEDGPDSRKLRASDLAGGLIFRLLNPLHLWQACRLQLRRKQDRRLFDDAQLALYSQILPSDFLHYGYFDNASIKAEEISLADVTRAQSNYSQRLLEL